MTGSSRCQGIHLGNLQPLHTIIDPPPLVIIMLSGVFHIFYTNWRHLLLRIAKTFPRLRSIILGTCAHNRHYLNTSEPDRDKQRAAFIEYLCERKSDILKLASTHHGGELPTEFRDYNFGSFNVCFFVEFASDGQRWVIRFPLKPVLYNPWQNVLSENTTMQSVTP